MSWQDIMDWFEQFKCQIKRRTGFTKRINEKIINEEDPNEGDELDPFKNWYCFSSWYIFWWCF